MSHYNTVHVSGSGFRPYDVVIGSGLLTNAATWVLPHLNNRRVFIVTDTNIAPLHLAPVKAQLEVAGIAVLSKIMPAGEETKSWDGLQTLMDAMLTASLDRKDVVIALGGGVIGDLTGFACAIYMRGIDFIQIPTTVLSQVDSSVGGKTAIDHPQGKNLIGAFWQPKLVLCDLDLLNTLPEREMRCGYAEVIKYGFLGDFAFFEWLEVNGTAVLAREPEALLYAITKSVATKADVVSRDEREGGVRALLNLGHTFGHALEAEMGFGDHLLHGEAVGLGMAQAFRYSARQGLCAEASAKRAIAAIAAAGLPTLMSQVRNLPFAADTLVTHMGHDKKAEGGKLTLILLYEIGQAYVAKAVDPQTLIEFLIEDGAITPL